jgi:excisionase family DNA binding protein
MKEGEATEQNAYLGAGEAARILEVSPKMVSRWADKGLIPCVTTLGGHRRFLRSTVEQIWRDMYNRPPATTAGAAVATEDPQ